MTQAVSGAPNVAAGDIHVTGRRILATIVDGLVLGLVYTVLALLFGTTAAEGGHVSATLPALPTVFYGVLVILYYILLEGYLGQTVGKMLLGIKVVREDNGEVPGVGGAAIRALLRVVDGLFSYLVAFIAVLVSAKKQRLGDMAAHTLVVRK